jgi:hypothetical protein
LRSPPARSRQGFQVAERELQRIHDGKIELTGQEPRDPRDVEFRIVCSNDRKLLAALLIGHYVLISRSSAGHSQKSLPGDRNHLTDAIVPATRLPAPGRHKYRWSQTAGHPPRVDWASADRGDTPRESCALKVGAGAVIVLPRNASVFRDVPKTTDNRRRGSAQRTIGRPRDADVREDDQCAFTM